MSQLRALRKIDPALAASTLKVALVFALVLVSADSAMAGTDETFDDISGTLSGWLGGSMGTVLTLTAVGIAAFGSVMKFNPVHWLGAAGTVLAVGFAPGFVESTFTALV